MLCFFLFLFFLPFKTFFNLRLTGLLCVVLFTKMCVCSGHLVCHNFLYSCKNHHPSFFWVFVFTFFFLFLGDFLTQRYTSLTDSEDKPDFCNFRLLLWQAGVHFSEVCEKRNRDVVTSFLRFVK